MSASGDTQSTAPSTRERHCLRCKAADRGDFVEPESAQRLIDNVNARLSGGLHGSFFESGSRLTEEKRKAQLPTLFKVVELLENIIKRQNANDAVHTDPEENGEKGQPAKMSGKPGKDMRAYIETVVQQISEPKMRDMDIKIERFKDELKSRSSGGNKKMNGDEEFSAAKEFMAKQENRIKALERKLAESKSESLQLRVQINQISSKMQVQGETINHLDYYSNLQGTDVRELRALVSSNQSDQIQIEANALGLTRRVDALDTEANALTSRLNDLQECCKENFDYLWRH